MKLPEYNSDAGPAEYEHRGGDECAAHGPNVPHFRLKGSTGPFYCVACAQEQLVATEPVSGTRPKLNGHPVELPGHAPDPRTVELQRDLAIATTEVARLRAEIDAERAAVTEWQAQNAQLRNTCQTLAVQLESKRVERWHATFNAALTGLLASPADDDGPECVAMARNAADEMHGPLETKPESKP